MGRVWVIRTSLMASREEIQSVVCGLDLLDIVQLTHFPLPS